MELPFNQSELDALNGEEFDLLTSIEISKEILEEESKKSLKSQLDFGSDIWELFIDTVGYPRKIDFNIAKDIVQFNKKIDKEDFIIVIKCWVASLIHQSSPFHVQSLYRSLVEFLRISNCFDYNVLDDVATLLENHNKTRKVYDLSLSALNFIEYYRGIDKDYKYGRLLSELRESLPFVQEARKLPPTKEVQVFHKIIEDYFNRIDKENLDYLFYFPIYFWWKLTMIIPLRPCELVKIQRDCLIEENGYYYIQLPRKKQKNKNRIQIIDKIMIPHKLANDIIHYQEKLKNFNKCTTLLHPGIKRSKKSKNQNLTQYTTVRHKYILSLFYKNIVSGVYGLTMKFDDRGLPTTDDEVDSIYHITKPIAPGDTRHFSMLNLMRQGYHPIEIARLAGHTSLYVQKNYYGHLEYWVDSTILELMEKITAEIETSKSAILDEDFKNNFVFKPIKDVKIPLDLGYCTDPNQNCAVESHFFCEYYRLTEEEYRTRQDEIKAALDDSNKKIKRILSILANLQRVSNTEHNYEYSHNDYLYNKDLIEIKKQLDVALHQYKKIKYHYERSKRANYDKG